MSVVRTDQYAVPFPTAGFRWLNKQHHLALEEIRGEATEHAFRKEGRVLNEGHKNPFMLERLHAFAHASTDVVRCPTRLLFD